MYVTLDLCEEEGKMIYLVSLVHFSTSTSDTGSFVLGYVCFLELLLELGIGSQWYKCLIFLSLKQAALKPEWNHYESICPSLRFSFHKWQAWSASLLAPMCLREVVGIKEIQASTTKGLN